ncbi:MAG: ion channel [Burkholderiales bacterium]
MKHDSGIAATSGPRHNARPEGALRWLVLAALLLTIPAFYLELISPAPVLIAGALYLLAAATTAVALQRSRRLAARHAGRQHARWPQWLLVVGLLLSGLLPPSSVSEPALGLRLVVAVGILARMIWMLRDFVTRGSVMYLLATALSVLGLCGLGFWWLEPGTQNLGDGLWLAFTTAATVGYGDIVPTTPASKIFSVFVVLLGYGVLSIVTAAIAAMWVETQGQRVEREILADLHREMKAVRADVAALRRIIESEAPQPGDEASQRKPP